MSPDNKKGLVVSGLMKLVLGFLFLGLVGGLLTQSPLADAILQGADMTEKNTDYTVDIHSRHQLSDLAMLVYQRAVNDGCKEGGGPDGNVWEQNNGVYDEKSDWKYGNPNQKGYPGLAESYLTRFPECYGASGSGVARPAGLTPGAQLGKDMEGIYSREKFEIKQKIVLKAGDTNTNTDVWRDFRDDGSGTWLERHFLVASKKSFEQNLECNEEDVASGTVGTASDFALYFEPEPPNERAEPWMEDDGTLVREGGPYCKTEFGNNVNDFSAIFTPTTSDPIGDKRADVVLCPGDKGYIQMNKAADGKGPSFDGEVGEDLGTAQKFGYIQITELGEDCEGFQKQIPPEQKSVGNTLAIAADTDEGWSEVELVELADIDTSGDGEVFGERTDVASAERKKINMDQDQCALYLREIDTRAAPDGVVYYNTGARIGWKDIDTFPDLTSKYITGQNLDPKTLDMYSNSDNSLEKIGFHWVRLGRDIEFLRNEEENSLFKPYGDLLCTGAEHSEAKWVVCDESNYQSPTTLTVSSPTGEDIDYQCEPSSGEWVGPDDEEPMPGP